MTGSRSPLSPAVASSPPRWEIGLYAAGALALLGIAAINLWKLWRSGSYPALSRLQDVDAPLHTQVDLGCNFFVSAEVPDPRRVFVALGFGFFAELTLPEALRHLERRSSLLQRLSESLTRDGAKIRAHIRLVLEGLRELQGLQEPPVTSDP